MLGREGTVQANLYQTNLAALSEHPVNGLLDGVVYRTHGDDDVSSIRSAIVVEQLVVCANLLIDLVHVFLNNRRKCIVVRVASLSYLEEDIRVLSRTALTRVVRVQCILTECIDCIHIYHIFQIFIIPGLDLLNLV